jgi:hypothetical protein
MYNLIAWLMSSPLRKCDNCGMVRLKGLMLHFGPGEWACDKDCRHSHIQAVSAW